MKIFEGFEENTNDGGFEKWCANLLTNIGYKCDLTPISGDYGIDIIATDPLGNKIGIQCKNWEGTVGINDVVKTQTGSDYYKLNSSMVFTTSDFTKEAQAIAKTKNIKLCTYEDLLLFEKLNGFELIKLKDKLEAKETEIETKIRETNDYFVNKERELEQSYTDKERELCLSYTQKELDARKTLSERTAEVVNKESELERKYNTKALELKDKEQNFEMEMASRKEKFEREVKEQVDAINSKIFNEKML